MTAIAALFAFCTMMLLPTGAFAAQHQQPNLSSFVQGTNANGDVFTGVMTVTNFATQGNQLIATGVLNGTLTPAGGAPQTVTNQPFSAPVASVAATCQILNLVLGPLSLNILGLNINLNQVVLNITAVPGPGNLLGNLLCAVAHLLDGGNLNNLLTQLVALLNQILGAL